MKKNPIGFEKLHAKIVARAWKDPKFKEKLLKNPRAAFKEMGLDVPANMQIKIQEDKSNSFTFVLPSPVSEVAELSDQELEMLAAGAINCGSCACGTYGLQCNTYPGYAKC